MSKPIVVPVDGTPLAEYALVPAVSIAKRMNERLHVMRVRASISTDGEDENVLAADEAYGLDLRSRIELEMSPEQLRVVDLPGSMPDTLLAYARNLDARMIVMATRRHAGLQQRVFSSVTDNVVRHAALPVLVCGPETADVERQRDWECTRILVPLDGSVLSRQIVPHARDLAAAFGAHVTLVRILPEPVPTIGWSAVPYDRDAEAAQENDEATDELESAAQVFRDAGVTVDARVIRTTRNVAEVITDEVVYSGADLIALATRGRGLAKRFAFGSVAHELTRRVLAPMLLLGPEDV